jgi:hypothetical protein
MKRHRHWGKRVTAIFWVAVVLNFSALLQAAPHGSMQVETGRSHGHGMRGELVDVSTDDMMAATYSVIVVTPAPTAVFIHPGAPQVHPTDAVMIHPSFDYLTPTASPIIVTTPPTVHPTDAPLIHPTDLPLVPKGTP